MVFDSYLIIYIIRVSYSASKLIVHLILSFNIFDILVDYMSDEKVKVIDDGLMVILLLAFLPACSCPL